MSNDKKRVEVTEAENGYTIRTWNCGEDSKEQELSSFYDEPETYVAKDEDEVLELVKKHLK